MILTAFLAMLVVSQGFVCVVAFATWVADATTGALSAARDDGAEKSDG